jgi:hypothetical protein
MLLRRSLLYGQRPILPTDISGIQLWLNNDPDTWFTTAAGSTLSSNGGLIGRWEDSSGLGRHFTTINANRPIRQDSQINGEPTVYFDGATDNLNAATASDWIFLHNAQATVYVVARVGTGVTNSVVPFIDTSNITTNNTGYTLFYDNRGAAGQGPRALKNTIYKSIANNFVVDAREIDKIDINSYGLLESYTDVTEIAANRGYYDWNRTGLVNPNTESFAAVNTNPFRPIRIGDIGTASAIDFSIAEVIIYDKVLDNGERTKLKDYILTKYGV